MPRRRPTAPEPSAADRVRALLARPAGGWVPPEEEPLGPAVPRPAVLEPPPLVADEPVVGEPVAPEAPEPPASGPAAPLAGLRSLLPVAVATARVQPGARAAVALLLAALLAAAVAGAVVLRGRPQEVAVPAVLATGVPLPGTSTGNSAGPSAPATGDVVVDVGGKVRRPGLVRLPLGSRVDDALRAAGGPLPGVDTGALNLARRLVDGEQVLVGVDPPPGAPAAGPAGAAAGALLDLNAAAAGDLDALPGIGPVLAQRIVDWRTEHGRFASVEQLREVTGIGEAKFEDLKSKVTV